MIQPTRPTRKPKTRRNQLGWHDPLVRVEEVFLINTSRERHANDGALHGFGGAQRVISAVALAPE
jgi:hypothetical protein